MNGIDPIDRFGRLDRRDIRDVDHHRFIVRAHQHAVQRLGGVGVDFLMRHVGRHEDEIARIGFGDEFELVAGKTPIADALRAALK